jgi:hypothetical protein
MGEGPEVLGLDDFDLLLEVLLLLESLPLVVKARPVACLHVEVFAAHLRSESGVVLLSYLEEQLLALHVALTYHLQSQLFVFVSQSEDGAKDGHLHHLRAHVDLQDV